MTVAHDDVDRPPTMRKRFQNALTNLLKADRHLFEAGVSEQAIAARFAVHLSAEFPDFDVDVEFNRDGMRTKRLEYFAYLLRNHGLSNRAEDKGSRRIFPDVIVHRRGTDDNLIAIEIKRTASDRDRLYDELKLQSMRDELGYVASAYVEFGSNPESVDDIVVVWNGDG